MEQNTNTTNVSQALLGANDKGRVTYEVNGETINLSFKIVRDYLTRGNAAVTDAEVIQFISLCRANQLNPFIGDAYLVKYMPRDPGRPADPAQMIISKGAFMKRGESSPQYKGYRAGVILVRGKDIVYEQGSFFLPGDTLVGGWAEVYRSDREHPITARVRLAEYNSGKSTWQAKPATMIRKVAIAQAFREAFPFAVEGMYTPEEMPDEQPAAEEANKTLPAFQPAPALQQGDKVRLPDGEVKEVIGSTDTQPAIAPDPEPVPIVVQKDKTDPKGERLPWEGDQEPIQEAGSQDANLDLFTV
jgi:phage recombination protein Bet